MNLLIIILGLLPGFAWLLFYLKEDLHPEPKKMLAKVFLVGALSAIAALGLAGVPPLNGFWSKELIVGSAVEHNILLGLLMFVIATLSALYKAT